MTPGDVVRVKVEGRGYLGIIEKVERKIFVRFTNGNTPTINLHRRSLVAFDPEQFEAYNKSGISWVVGGVR